MTQQRPSSGTIEVPSSGAGAMSPADEVPAGSPQSAQNNCPACGGTGHIDSAPCPACGGRGTITELVGDA